jgi:Na+-transporting methylmalonyl-CoA/oxaloacetate decarboxylase gamma subunit
MAIGMGVVLIAISFLSDVWEGRPSRVEQRQMEEIEETKKTAVQDTSWKAWDRETNQESDSARRDLVQQDSIARARAEKAARGW